MSTVSTDHMGRVTTDRLDGRIEDMKPKSISEALLGAIRRSELSLRALEARSGVTRAALSRFVNGKRSLTLPSVDALASALGLELVETARSAKGSKR